MKKSFLIVLLAGLGLSVSCSRDRIAEDPQKGVCSATSYTVPQEEALAELQHTLEGMQTGGRTRGVMEVQTLWSNEIAETRAAEEPVPLAYIVNFDAGGYAILGADLRQEPVVAIVNEGSMTAETLAAARRTGNTGEAGDSPVFVNAMVTDYLVKSLAENAPQPRIQDWVIKEHKMPMLLTKWGPRNAFSTGCVAICQLLVYNGRFNRVRPPQFMGYRIPDWTALSAAAATATPSSTCKDQVDNLCIEVNSLIWPIQSGTRQIETITTKIQRSASSYYKNTHFINLISSHDISDAAAGRIRSRLWENNMPIYMEGNSPTAGHHAWVIDGWMLKELPTGIGWQYYAYCNFGLNGSGDGLYSFSVFGACEDLAYICYDFD